LGGNADAHRRARAWRRVDRELGTNELSTLAHPFEAYPVVETRIVGPTRARNFEATAVVAHRRRQASVVEAKRE
jgi:hypothetical protein